MANGIEVTMSKRCPYCGDEDVAEEHIFNCDPFER